MTAEETLEIVSKQWCSLEDLMKINKYLTDLKEAYKTAVDYSK